MRKISYEIEVEYQEGKIEESGITEVDNSANEFFSLAAPIITTNQDKLGKLIAVHKFNFVDLDA